MPNLDAQLAPFHAKNDSTSPGNATMSAATSASPTWPLTTGASSSSKKLKRIFV